MKIIIDTYAPMCGSLFSVFIYFFLILQKQKKNQSNRNEKKHTTIFFFWWNCPIDREIALKKKDLFYVCNFYFLNLYIWLIVISEQPISVHIWHCVINWKEILTCEWYVYVCKCVSVYVCLCELDEYASENFKNCQLTSTRSNRILERKREQERERKVYVWIWQNEVWEEKNLLCGHLILQWKC